MKTDSTIGRKGDWITLQSGIAFWPLDPRVEDIHIEDIAHGLSNICRFGGHCKQFYSVAQHSLLVSNLGGTKEERRWGLMHDSAEAYIGDIVRPVKRHVPAFQEIEDQLLVLIAEKFDLGFPMPERVKEADEIVLATEARDIMAPECASFACIPGRPSRDFAVVPVSPEEARRAFMEEFHRLFSEAP